MRGYHAARKEGGCSKEDKKLMKKEAKEIRRECSKALSGSLSGRK
jgi:hypothetical protein